MPLVLNATPAATDANAYCTLAEAEQYHLERLHNEAWDGADDVTKTTALVMATRLLDQMFIWDQFPTTVAQALQWPRTGMVAANGLYEVGVYEIPRELKWATAEFARQLIGSDSTANSDIETQGISSLSAGSVSLSFREDVKPKVVPDAVVLLLPSWWFTLRTKSIGIRDLMRA